jgi:energy-coupling factor transport system ATP-binding protein
VPSSKYYSEGHGVLFVDNILELNNLCYAYPGTDSKALSDVSLHAAAGECICITGPSGCGKSTLLLALKGLLREGELEGEITYGGGVFPKDSILAGVGLVFQNAESQLLCATVYDEVAFGPENLRLPPPEINRRIVDSLSAVGLLEFGNRNVERFSAGQKQRLSIASILAMHPDVILLDEPTSQLDRRGKEELRAVLDRLKSDGITIIIAEHNIEPFAGLADRYYLMADGAIIGALDEPPGQYRGMDLPACRRNRDRGAKPSSCPALSAEGIFFSYPGGDAVLRDISLDIASGELVHVYGDNGCGKSTLLKVMAGGFRPDSGNLCVDGRNFPKAGGLLGTVALLFQNPQRQLFEDTVRDEVAFSLRRLKVPSDETDLRVTSALEACEASHLAERLPLTLSFGEQHRVALASVIAPDPRVLLLDEPFAGLDQAQRLRLLDILASLRANRGTSVVIASHDPLPDHGWADRIVSMEDGEITCGAGGRS